MQQLASVFINEGSYCPGFQFLPGGAPHPGVAGLFSRAMELKVPNNYFAVWMVTPLRGLAGYRPVDCPGRNDLLRRQPGIFAQT
ncbi:hypothetical protein [Pseudarthrobacter sp. S9]|uniref:hypothetical protein n=1 Tax=Pseudarthrobacter sp. S9 TaxID=3418421 RepID=UPI003CFBEF5A